MNEEDNQINSDASNESSSETQDQSVESTESQGTEAQAADKGDSESNVPFHEHPRFKELVEQKNTYAEQVKQFQAKLQELEARQQATQSADRPNSKYDSVLKQLREASPEFADLMSEIIDKSKMLDEVNSEVNNLRTTAFASQAVTRINELHAEHKVLPALKERYNREIDWAYRTGEIKTQADVDRVYKQVHKQYSELLDDVKRTERETYVSDKRKDSAGPRTQTKGQAVQHGKKPEFSKDPALARKELVDRVLKIAKSNSDL